MSDQNPFSPGMPEFLIAHLKEDRQREELSFDRCLAHADGRQEERMWSKAIQHLEQSHAYAALIAWVQQFTEVRRPGE